MRSYTPGLLQSYKSYLYDEIDEGFWFGYMLSTWLRQVVDELVHIHEVLIKIWTRGQILTQKSTFSESLQTKREHRPRRCEPNANYFISNRHRE
jgi:hypothetical protein